jgi:hypothetical protein
MQRFEESETGFECINERIYIYIPWAWKEATAGWQPEGRHDTILSNLCPVSVLTAV